MRTIIISDTFYPDNNSASKILLTLANHLKNKTELYVLCAQKEKINTKLDFKIISVNSPKKKSLFLRLINEFFLPYKLISKYKQEKKSIIDKIFVYSPSIFLIKTAKKIKSKNTEIVLILRDIFPDWAVSLGLIKNRSIVYFFNYFKNIQFEVANKIAIQTENDINFIPLKYRHKVIIIKNWSNKNSQEKKLELNNNTKDILYLGNLGIAQDPDKLFNIISSEDLKIYNFKIYSEIPLKFKKYSEYFKNIEFFNYTEEEKIFSRNYIIGIICLSDNLPNNNIPGKFISYIENSIPVILIHSIKTDLSELIIKYNVGEIVCNQSEFVKKLNKILNNYIYYKNNCEKLLINEFNINNIDEFKL